MKQLNGYMIRSIRDMLTWNVLRFVLFVGLPLMALWLWIGYELWDYAVAVASVIVGWVPFSIVKANGAQFIAFFLWFVAVLVSFAVLTALVGPPILRFFKHRTYYVYTFTTLILLSAFWAWFILIEWDFIDRELQQLLTELPFQTVADGIAWLLAFYFFYNGFILTLYLVVSFFRKSFLERIRERDYPDVPMTVETVKKVHHVRLLWDIVTFLFLSLLLIPLLFVPDANVLMQLLLWAWLYRESYFLSTCTLYCTEKDYRYLREQRMTIWGIAVMTALFNFLPVINVFAPFFAQIMFFHWIMEHQGEAAAKGTVSQTEEKSEEEPPAFDDDEEEDEIPETEKKEKSDG